MPKISELTAGATPSGSELIPAVQSGVTKRFTVAQIAGSAGSGIYNVRNYGATGDGVTDDSVAIRAAKNAAKAAGGGTVYFPAGTYILTPTSTELTDGGGLNIFEADNITILGDGWPGRSKIKYLCFGGVDPDVAPPTLDGSGAVFRGAAIHVYSQTGFRIEGIEIDGSASVVVGTPIPADPVTGNGWDITHHAIQFDPNVAHDKIIIKDCWFHNFRGEILAYGGDGLQRIRISDCVINGTGTDGTSITGRDMEIRNCEIYNCLNGAIENAYFSGRNVYAGNYIHDCGQGFAVYPVNDNEQQGFVDLYDNHLKNCTGQAFYVQGANNMRIYNNYMIDCNTGVLLHNHGSGGSGTETIYADNVQIYNNTFATDTISTSSQAIYIEFTSGEPMKKVLIQNNVANVTAWGETGGKTHRGVFGHLQPMLHGTGQNDVQVSGNQSYSNNLGFANTDAWIDETVDRLLTNTTENSVLFIQDDRDFLRTFDVFYEVKVAATTLLLKIKYYDDTGSQQIITWVTGSQPVGVYSASYNVSPHYGSNNNNTQNVLELTATAGTANQVTISARCRD